MKTLSKNTIALTSMVALAATAVLALPAQATAGGTDILHYTIAKTMTDTGVESNNADGLIVASQKEQGKANNQKLSIVLVGLTANTDYELMATVDADTNIVDVGPFTTDSRGRAALQYAYLGNGHGGGKKHIAMPDTLDSVSLIRELDVYNTNADLVLTADLSNPDKLQYLIKHNFSDGNAKGTLMIQATTKRTQFKLMTKGLMPKTDYWLSFNGDVVQTNTTDAKGRLNIKSSSETPTNILDLRSVQLWDTSTNLIFEADLP